MAGTKADLIEMIAKRGNLPAPVASASLEAFLEVFVENLVTEGRLELREFGVFRVRDRKRMFGRNPRTGETVALPKRRFVSFKMGRVMRERFGGDGESKRSSRKTNP